MLLWEVDYLNNLEEMYTWTFLKESEKREDLVLSNQEILPSAK